MIPWQLMPIVILLTHIKVSACSLAGQSPPSHHCQRKNWACIIIIGSVFILVAGMSWLEDGSNTASDDAGWFSAYFFAKYVQNASIFQGHTGYIIFWDFSDCLFHKWIISLHLRTLRANLKTELCGPRQPCKIKTPLIQAHLQDGFPSSQNLLSQICWPQ